MNTPINENTLAAYVLGELTEEEVQQVEAALKDNAELRDLVERTRQSIEVAQELFQTEPELSLSEAQQEGIREKAKGNRKAERSRGKTTFVRFLEVMAVAACLLIMASIAIPNLTGYISRGSMQQTDMATYEMEAGPIRLSAKHTSSRPAPSPASISDYSVDRNFASSPAPRRREEYPVAAEAGAYPPVEEATESLDLSFDSEDGWDELSPGMMSGAGGFAGTTAKYARSGYDREQYARIYDNPVKAVADEPLSTFSIDVDTASYANVRRFLNQGGMPPPDAVRIEEMVNYFDYAYAPPESREEPFSAHVTVTTCPWDARHQLARIGLKGWEMPRRERPATNLVFLLDVSGSMSNANKLPLVKQSIRMLVQQLDERDRVAMVVYAGASGLVLPATPGHNRRAILGALDQLNAGGSTNGGAGIELAYRVAQEAFIEGGVNRVILATDGDFNVGTTDQGSLTRLIEEKAKKNVFLTVLGFGMGNLNDSTMEQLADKGNGNYAYIDSQQEADKVLRQDMMGTMVTIAKDVKIQIEFNPSLVAGYRLIGYENRILAAEDFNDDTKDAGEIGAGHTVTALYEIVPAGQPLGTSTVDAFKYQQAPKATETSLSDELFTLKLRHKTPEGSVSRLQEFPVRNGDQPFAKADPDFKFAAAVAGFGMLLRHSQHAGDITYENVLEWAEDGAVNDQHGFRTEFINLVRKAKSMR
jgi:Ca-activated chloride channel homolog